MFTWTIIEDSDWFISTAPMGTERFWFKHRDYLTMFGFSLNYDRETSAWILQFRARLHGPTNTALALRRDTILARIV